MNLKGNLTSKGLQGSIGKSRMQGILGTNPAAIPITVDNALSLSSTNPVQNKVITQAITGRLLSDDVKAALLQIAQKVAYIDAQGQDYYDDLYDALYPPVGLDSISAVFDAGGATIYNTDTLDDLKQYLTVTAYYTSGDSEEVTTYTLSGSMDAGTQTITVSYGGKSTTFTVTVVEWVTSISAVFTQGNRTIFSNADLDSLKEWLVVTATYADSSVAVLDSSNYSLSGTLSAGTSVVTALAGSASDTFSVTVTAFVIPEGYTRYDYIQKKTTANNKVTLSGYIILPDQPNMSVLSLEMYLSLKGNTTYAGQGILGARANSYDDSYSVYWNEASGIFGRYGRGGFSKVFAATSNKTKLKIINNEESPAYWQINDGELTSLPWSSTPTNNAGFTLFNNIPKGSTASFDINPQARIGDITLTKADGECVGYYIPCTHNGVIGMYDIISEEFYTAATASVVTISNSGCLYAVGNW